MLQATSVRAGEGVGALTLQLTHKWSVFGPVTGSVVVPPSGNGQ